MNRFKSLLIGLVALLGFALPALGQTALTTTTLSSAVSDSKTQTIVVASATGISAPSPVSANSPFAAQTRTVLWIEGEAMLVTGVNGTTITVTRGYNQTRGAPHNSGVTVQILPFSGAAGGVNSTLVPYARLGGCTASNEPYLPKIVGSVADPNYAGLEDCFGSQWQFDLSAIPLYKFVVAPNAPRSVTTTPGTAGTASSITAQAGGVTTNSGGTGGAGAAASLVGGAGGAASTGSATGGAGGAANVTGGAGAGTITGGAGGKVAITAGVGGNGSTAGGSGGNVDLRAGAAGTGGTGTAGTVRVLDAADATKIASLDASGITTASTRSYKLPDNTGGIAVTYSCGDTGSGNQNCTVTAANALTKIYNGRSTLSSNTATITFAQGGFTSTTSYFCLANDVTTRANPVQMVPASATTATITNTTGASDSIQWICIGQ